MTFLVLTMPFGFWPQNLKKWTFWVTISWGPKSGFHGFPIGFIVISVSKKFKNQHLDHILAFFFLFLSLLCFIFKNFHFG